MLKFHKRSEKHNPNYDNDNEEKIMTMMRIKTYTVCKKKNVYLLTYRIRLVKIAVVFPYRLHCCPFAVVLCTNCTSSMNFESTNWKKQLGP